MLPNRTYETIIITENNQIIEYVGNQGIIDNLLTKGVEHPITSHSKKTIKSRLVSGAMNATGDFPLKTTIEEANSELSGSITKLEKRDDLTWKLKGIIIYGHSNEDLQITVDSVSGSNDKSFENSLKQSMESVMNQIIFPEEKIQIGKSFVLETPMKVPAENGKYFDFVLKNTYTLDSVKSQVAYFSIHQDIVMKTAILNNEMTLTGEGSGSLHFDLDNKSYKLFETETIMNSIVMVKDFEVHTKGITKSRTVTIVE